MTNYTRWALQRWLKKTAAIVLIAPFCAIFLPFVLVGDAFGRLFRRLYYSR